MDSMSEFKSIFLSFDKTSKASQQCETSRCKKSSEWRLSSSVNKDYMHSKIYSKNGTEEHRYTEGKFTFLVFNYFFL